MSLNLPKVTGALKGISPLIMGGAVFNTQYNDEPASIEVKKLLVSAFQKGINAIDTSPYYGPSEELLGDALKELLAEKKIVRENYYICTKVGRVKLDDFDYSPEWIRKSIARSLQRLGTSYLDVVFLHDVEFVQTSQIYTALKTMMELKKEGIIHNVGISGYPVDFLYQIASAVPAVAGIGPLDIVMSYCNMCLQNNTLLKYYDKFMQTGIKLLDNASILSMSLLRAQETRSFHPGPSELKNRVAELATEFKNKQVDLAELATRYAIREWIGKNGRTVIGVSNVAELNSAWEQYQLVVSGKLDEDDSKRVQYAQSFLGEHFNETWSSGIVH